MTAAWYRVASFGFGYVAAALVAAILLLAVRRHLADRRLWRRVGRELPQARAAGMLRVLSPGGRRLSAGEEILVPYEGTLGSASSCDVRVPYRKVHMRSAFFWMERGALHMVALHRDGFEVDGVPVEPGDEAVMDDGAVLRVGELKMVLRLNGKSSRRSKDANEPYVTSARRSRAQQGRGEGIGAPGRVQARREKRLLSKQGEAERPDDAGRPKAKSARRAKNTKDEKDKKDKTRNSRR